MGKYTEFRINHQEVYSTKWGYHPELLLIFAEPDRHLSTLDQDGEWGLQYRTTARIARERLDLLGYDISVARQVFITERARLLREWQELHSKEASDSDQGLLLEAATDFLTRQTFVRWVDEMRAFLHSSVSGEESRSPPGLPAFDYLYGEKPWDILGFPGRDVLAFLRGALEACNAHDVVCYDLGSLVDRGYVDLDEGLATQSRLEAGAHYLPNQRIIVLTEGTVDARVLNRSMKLLAPHLADYFSFLTFDELKVPGGAGTALSFAKAFVAAGVANRIIAILDNDTAAREASRSMTGLPLPDRVKVIHYPELATAMCYPTIGPTGRLRHGC